MSTRLFTVAAFTTVALTSAFLSGCQNDAISPRAAVTSPTRSVGAATVVPGQYVVLFRRERVARSPFRASELSTQKLAGGRGALVRTFGHSVQGFAARLSDSAVVALRADPDVAIVAPDPIVHATGTRVEFGAPWGLDRIDQASLPLDGSYHYGPDGTGTSVYVVDTGINLTHTEFGGRAVTGIDFVSIGGTATDCNGHGTHVAGTVGGATYGVAKGARLVAVRVLDCSGNGYGSDVIAGLDWIVQQKVMSPSTPMVVNMSLEGDAAAVIDSAVQWTVAAGVSVVAAAGNSAGDACTTSPARAPDAITVAATDASDNFAGFSNFGPCVDLAAPGVAIASAYVGSNTATAVMSGTSMATPHVAGAAALYLSTTPAATPAQVAAALTGHAVGGSIQGLPPNTTSLLLDVEFLAGTNAAVRTGSALRSVASGLCVDVANGSRANGTRLQGWTCYGNANQRLLLPAPGTVGAIQTANGSCLDAIEGGTRDGERVGIWACNGGPHQQWTLTADGQVQDAATGLCLDLDGGRRVNGVRVQLWTCLGNANQRWATAAE